MLWQRENERFFPFLRPEKKVIHGHTITPIQYIEEYIIKKTDFIGIDNGCYYAIKTKDDNYYGNYFGEYGRLCAFDIDNWKLYTQKCVD
jgi:hypothetical protein